MEGSSHTPPRPLPTEPKPNPPRPQTKKSIRAKRAKNTHAIDAEAPPLSHTTTTAEPSKPIEYCITGMLSSHESYPRDLKTIKVTLSVPSPDEECPIALEPINTAQLEFLPGCSFLQDTPQYTKMTLPCGHSFSAMVIIYSWCKREMLCPCCRQGLKCRANVNRLPSHFRSQLAAHISNSLSSERVEDEREIIRSLLQMTPITTSFETLAVNACLEIIVGFSFLSANETRQETLARPANQRVTSSVGYFSMMFNLVPVRSHRQGRERTLFTPSEQSINVLRHSPSGVRSLNITTQMRIRNAGIIDVDSSGEIDFPEPIQNTGDLSRVPMVHRRVTGYSELAPPHRRRVLPVVPISTFELVFGQRGGQVFLDNITWLPDSTHVHVSLHATTSEI